MYDDAEPLLDYLEKKVGKETWNKILHFNGGECPAYNTWRIIAKGEICQFCAKRFASIFYTGTGKHPFGTCDLCYHQPGGRKRHRQALANYKNEKHRAKLAKNQEKRERLRKQEEKALRQERKLLKDRERSLRSSIRTNLEAPIDFVWTAKDARVLTKVLHTFYDQHGDYPWFGSFNVTTQNKLLVRELIPQNLLVKFDKLSEGDTGRASLKKAALNKVCPSCKQKILRTVRTAFCSPCLEKSEVKEITRKRKTRKAKKTSLERYGVDNPSKAKEIKERIKDAFRRLDPKGEATNAMHLAKYRKRHREAMGTIDREASVAKMRETYLQNWDAVHWLRSEEGKRHFDRLMKARFGGESNAMNVPEIRERHLKIMERNFSDPEWVKAWKSKVLEGARREYGVDNVFQHSEIIAKIQQTMLDRYGYKHALQVPEFRIKQLKNSYSVTERVIKGKRFLLQGFEEFVLNRMLKHRPVEDIDGQPLKGLLLPDGRLYRPDFYIRSKDVYIEVKSDFTLIEGHKKKSALRGNRYRARHCQNVVWVVAYPSEDLIVRLPKEWPSWNVKELRRKLAEKRKQHAIIREEQKCESSHSRQQTKRSRSGRYGI